MSKINIYISHSCHKWDALWKWLLKDRYINQKIKKIRILIQLFNLMSQILLKNKLLWKWRWKILIKYFLKMIHIIWKWFSSSKIIQKDWKTFKISKKSPKNKIWLEILKIWLIIRMYSIILILNFSTPNKLFKKKSKLNRTHINKKFSCFISGKY
jgi:hypothetical protein